MDVMPPPPSSGWYSNYLFFSFYLVLSSRIRLFLIIASDLAFELLTNQSVADMGGDMEFLFVVFRCLFFF